MPFKDSEKKRQWRLDSADEIRAYHLAWVERRKLIDPEFAAKCAEQEARKAHREREKAEKKAKAEAEREAKRLSRQAEPEERRAICSPKKRKGKKSRGDVDGQRRRRRERIAADPAFAEECRRKDRERYAANEVRRIEKIKRQSQRRMDLEFARLHELETHATTIKPCKRCGKPVVGKRMTAKYCSSECHRSWERENRNREPYKAKARADYAAISWRLRAAKIKAVGLQFCLFCETEIDPGAAGPIVRKFCSRECGLAHQRATATGSWNKWANIIGQAKHRKRNAFCPVCRKQIVGKIRYGERPKYCSLRCGLTHIAQKKRNCQ